MTESNFVYGDQIQLSTNPLLIQRPSSDKTGRAVYTDNVDRHEIKVSSFMIGEAVRKRPDLAAEIVHRGHEAGAHGRTWTPSYLLSKEEEKAFIQDNVQTVKRVTGFQPVGWNAYWIRNSANTLEILQDLGFI